jgi:hypothetical protein
MTIKDYNKDYSALDPFKNQSFTVTKGPKRLYRGAQKVISLGVKRAQKVISDPKRAQKVMLPPAYFRFFHFDFWTDFNVNLSALLS